MRVYGEVLYEYEGTGVLEYEGEGHPCRFVTGQLSNGSVILLCEFEDWAPEPLSATMLREKPITLAGETSAGMKVTVSGSVRPVSWLSDTTATVATAFRASELHVGFREAREVSEIRFGLTNLKFIGTQPQKDGSREVWALPVAMHDLGVERDALVVPLSDYEAIVTRLGTIKDTNVTAELVVPYSEVGERKDALQQWVDDLCYVLSVARGTKVQWVFREERTNEGAVAARTHADRVTKPYSVLPVIDPGPSGRFETQDFVATGMTAYAERRDAWKLNRGVIDNYLDARLDEDYLELRGSKMAVTIEALKAVFLEQPDAGISEHILDSKDFEERLLPSLLEAIKGNLREARVSSEVIASVASKEKVGSLNRRGFRSILRALCSNLGVTVSKSELKHFVQSRNKLVHVGKYYCQAATAEERESSPPLATPLEEFLFLVNFLDRIFLKLLGYAGTYLDWRKRPHVRAELR